jgi:7-keto-8-aminopelargonate synthetase-like enzyme
VGPIVPIVLGDARRTMLAAETLLEQGIYVRGIRPPTVPEGTCRLRLTVSAQHTPAQLDRALEVLIRVLAALPPE